VTRDRLRALLAGVAILAAAATFSTRFAAPVAALAGAAGLLLAGGSGIPRERVFWFLAGPLLAGGVLSLLAGAAPGPGCESFGILLAALGFFALRRKGETDRAVDLLFAAAAGALAVAGLAEFFVRHAPPRLWMISPIDFGLAVLLLGLWGSRAVTSTMGRTLYLLLVLACVALSTSRALLAAGLLAVLLLPGPRLRRLLLVLVLVAAVPLVVQRLAGDTLAWHRSHIYAATVNLARERPLTGWGYGAFDAVSRRALLADPLPARHLRVPLYAHCDALELLFEIGLPLAAAAVAGYLALLLALRRARPQEAAVLTAIGVTSLFYFPLRLSFPLFIAGFAASAALPPATGRHRILLGPLGALPLLLYGAGLLSGNPTLAPANGRLALEALDPPAALYRLTALEPERAEAWHNLGVYAASTGSSNGAWRAMAAAAARAPFHPERRLEMARADLWLADLAVDTTTRERFRRRAFGDLGLLAALEPLALAPHAARGDTRALSRISLDLELAHESERNRAVLRRLP